MLPDEGDLEERGRLQKDELAEKVFEEKAAPCRWLVVRRPVAVAIEPTL